MSTEPNKLARYIKDLGLSYKETSQSFIFNCPLCSGKDKLYIRKSDGRFRCFKCATDNGFSGNPEYALIELTGLSLSIVKQSLYGSKQEQSSFLNVSLRDFFDTPEEEFEVAEPVPELSWPYHCIPINHGGARKGLDYLQSRGINLDIATFYRIRYSPENRAVVFPVYNGEALLGWQYRTIDPTRFLADGIVKERPKAWSSPNLPRDKVFMFSDRLIGSKHAILCEGPIDAIKCFGEDTPVLMFDRAVKRIQDVKVGDLVMGPDSRSRTVIGASSGVGALYKISPREGGEPWVCNQEHTLVLKSRMGYPKKDNLKIPVLEYIGKAKNFKNAHGLFRVPLSGEDKDLPIDPYILGVWLGDGDSNRACLTSMDHEISDRWIRWVLDNGDYVEVCKKKRQKASRFFAKPYSAVEADPRVFKKRQPYSYKFAKDKAETTTVSKRLLKDAGLLNNKHIPAVYLEASVSQRLQLLAGFLDTDGTLSKNSFVIAQSVKRERLLKQAAFLARSLGFRATITYFMGVLNGKRTPQIGMHISGKTTSIPTLLPRKRPHKDGVEDPLVSGFNITPCGQGNFFGIETDGDHMFLLSDCTVVHNCHLAKGNVAAMGKSISSAHVKTILRSGIKTVYAGLDPDAFAELDPLMLKLGNDVTLYRVEVPDKGEGKTDLGALSMEEAYQVIKNSPMVNPTRLYVWMRPLQTNQRGVR